MTVKTATHAAPPQPHVPPAAKPPAGPDFHGAAATQAKPAAVPMPNLPGLPTMRQIDGGLKTLAHPLDPKTQIDRLDGKGDSATFSVTVGGKFRVANPITDVPAGPQVSYGFDAKVTQADPHKPGGPPTYEVTFGKNVQGGLGVEGGVGDGASKISLTGELNLGTADRVTMRFDSKEDAAKAVRVAEQMTTSQAVRDAKFVTDPEIDLMHPFDGLRNPMHGNDVPGEHPSGLMIPLGNPLMHVVGAVTGPLLDHVADQIGPSAADKQFMRDHVSSYSTQVTGSERATVEASLGPLTGQGRITGADRITRTVTLPQDGKPGTLSYTAGMETTLDARERLKFKTKLDGLGDLSPVGSNVADLAKSTTEITTTYTLTPQESAAVQQSGGMSAPDLGILRNGRKPDTLTVKSQFTGPAQNPFTPTRTDQGQLTTTFTVKNPSDHAAALVRGLTDGHMTDAIDGLKKDGRVQMEGAYIQRDGTNNNWDLGLSKTDVFSVGVSAQMQVGTDHIAQKVTLMDTAPPPASTPTQPSAPKSGETPAPTPSAPPRPAPFVGQQVVVTPHDGLNVRMAPGTGFDKVGVLRNGSFLQTTGPDMADAAGRHWTPVSGTGVDDKPVRGWVATEYTKPHAAGAMNDTGRTDPALGHAGDRAVVARDGDSVWSIAARNGANPEQTEALNRDHLIEPDLIFKGDTVYLPKSP